MTKHAHTHTHTHTHVAHVAHTQTTHAIYRYTEFHNFTHLQNIINNTGKHPGINHHGQLSTDKCTVINTRRLIHIYNFGCCSLSWPCFPSAFLDLVRAQTLSTITPQSQPNHVSRAVTSFCSPSTHTRAFVYGAVQSRAPTRRFQMPQRVAERCLLHRTVALTLTLTTRSLLHRTAGRVKG